jgi:hypothetical protein
MAHAAEVREKLRRLIVHDRLSLEVAARAAGVSYATGRRWKTEADAAGDDWDKAQTAQLMAGGSIETIARQMLAGLLTQYQTTIEKITDDDTLAPADKVQMLASLADAYNKTISASKRILPETNELAVAMGVVQKLAAFIKEHYAQHVAAFAEVLEPFGTVLREAYG